METIVINKSDYQDLISRVAAMELRLQSVTLQNKSLLEVNKQLQTENKKLRSENKKLITKLSSISRNYSELSVRHRKLESDYKKLSGEYEILSTKYQEVTSKSKALEETVLSLNQRLFGKKSDRIRNKASVSGHTGKTSKAGASGAKRGRKKLATDYKADEERSYDFESAPECCGQQMLYIGSNNSHHEDYEVIFKKVQIKQAKYVCNCCNVFKVANGVKLPIPKGLPLPSLLRKVILDKFSSAVPFYRQAQNFTFTGVKYSRQLLTGWFCRASDLIEPLVELMYQKMEQSDYLMSDETPLTLLDKEDGKSGNGYACIIKEAGKKFNFVYVWILGSRCKEAIIEKLKRFSGYLQTDGLSFYHEIQSRIGIIKINCWAHARRYFVEVANLAGKGKRSGIAFKVVEMIDKLYAIEERGRLLGLPELLRLRQEESAPILNKIKEYLEIHKDKVPPKSAIAKAINYTLVRWDALNTYLKDPKIEIDNNATERCVKYLVMGRKNWLFVQNIKSAEKLAMLYSLIITCKFNNINPQEYLEYVLTQMPYINRHNKSELERLLPDRYDVNKRFDYEYRQRLDITEAVTISEKEASHELQAA